MLFQLICRLAFLFVAMWAENLAEPLTAEAAEVESTVHRIVILHTNDLHGHLTAWKGWQGELRDKSMGGLDRLAGAIAQAREENNGEVLLLDAGDLIGDTMIADLTQGKALIEALNYLNYDALTVGNHEPDFKMEVLRQLSQEAKFPLLAANLTASTDERLFTKPYVVKMVNGVRVGVLGLAYPKTERTTSTKNVEAVTFHEPVQSLQRFLPKLRDEGAVVVIVLSHLGLSGDKKLAEAVQGIDVIVGGHSHNRMIEAERVGNTLIVQAGAHGSDLGRLDLTIEKGKITAHNRKLIPLDHESVPSDPTAKKLLDEIHRPYRKSLDEVVGEAGEWLVRAQTLAGQEARMRNEESPIDSLFADILRVETKADIGLLPGVGYGVAIPPGPVKAAELRQMIPHQGKVVTLRLTGTQVIEILEQAIENVFTDDPRVKVGGMVQVSGIRFRYDPVREKGQRVWHVSRPEGGWDVAASYLVVTNSMMSEGGHNYQTFTAGESLTVHGSQYEMIRRWFTNHSPIVTPPVGRIVQAPQP